MKKLTFSMIFVALTVIVFGQTVQNAKTAREAGVVSVSHDVISPKSNSFTEGFEAFVIPGTMNGWTRIQTNANVTWDTTSFDPYTGSRYVGCTYDYVSVTPELQNEWLITPALDLSAATDVTVSFAWRGSKYYSLFPYDDCDLLLKYSIDGGTTWSSPVWNELTDDTTLFVSWTWAVANVNIPGVSGQSNVKFALNYYGTDGSEFDVDDFKVDIITAAVIYPIKIAGVTVTEDNKNAVPIQNGSAIYNSDTRTLELEDANQGTQVYAYSTHGVYISAPAENGVEYTIHGDVWQADYFLIEVAQTGQHSGIYSLANLKLIGLLDIDAPYYGINMVDSASLTIQDADIKVSGIVGHGGDLIIRNSEVIITSGGVSDFTNIYFFGSYIDSPAGAVREGGAIKLNGNLYTGEIVIKKGQAGVDIKEASINNAWASSGTLYIEYNQGTKATAEVFSLTGAKVANIPLNTGINSQAMDRGIYIVRIGNENHKVSVK